MSCASLGDVSVTAVVARNSASHGPTTLQLRLHSFTLLDGVCQGCDYIFPALRASLSFSSSHNLSKATNLPFSASYRILYLIYEHLHTAMKMKADKPVWPDLDPDHYQLSGQALRASWPMAMLVLSPWHAIYACCS